MVRRKAKLNSAVDDLQHAMALNITAQDWARIETAYKQKLSPALRNEIYATTWWFMSFAPSEASAEAVSAAVDNLAGVRKAGQEFLDLYLLNFKSEDGSAQLVAETFDAKTRHIRFHSDLTAYIEACDFALTEIRKPANHGWRSGGMWQLWIRRLTEILKEVGLPHQARKDDAKLHTASVSPFVELVHELQLCIPAEFRRSTQSKGALAATLGRARRDK